MVKGINSTSVNNINFNTPVKSPQLDKIKNTTSQETSSLSSAVTVDYNVKIPQSYTKIGIEKLSNGQEIHCFKLSNGQKVMIAPMKSPKTYVNTYVNTGAMNEKDNERGISHYNEHMAFNGTLGTDGYMKLGVGDVFRKVAEMGGETNACTGMAETNYTIGIPQLENNDLETAVAMQAAMMNNLAMPDDMVIKEHGPVCQEINMYSDIMPVKANNIAIKNLYNIQSTSEDLVAGRVDNIQNIDRKKVMDYYKNNYYPANMITVITGDVNPDDAINLVAKHFRGENKPNPDRRFEYLKPINKTVRRDVISDKAISTNATIAFNGPANNDAKGQLAVDAALSFLFAKSNSRIGAPLRELNSNIEPSINKVSTIPNDGVAIAFDIDTTEANSEKALKTVFTELQNFKIKDEIELQQIKNSLKSQNQDKYENPDRLNYMIGSNSLNFDISNVANQDKIIDSLTIKDVEDAVHNYLDINKASIAVVHPSTETAESLKMKYNNVNSTTGSAISFRGRVQSLPIDVNKVSNYKLNNNYDIAFLDTPFNSNAKAVITYTPQTKIETKPGVPQLLTRMLKDKTANKDLSEFNNYLDNNNLVQEVSVSDMGEITIKGKMPSENVNEFLKITQEQLMMPHFDIDTLEKQKGVLKELYEHAEPNPLDGILKSMYPDSQLGYTPEDVLNNIDNITINDITDYYNQIMQNSSATVAIAAPMTDRKVMNTVLSSMAQMPVVKSNQPQLLDLYKPTAKSVVVTKEAPHAQADIIQSYNFKNNGNVEDLVKFTLMKGILSNGDDTGLFNNLREKEKLAYAVWADYDNDGNNARISCNIKTTTDNPDTGEHTYDNIQKSINGFNKQIEKMKKGEFTDKELEIAKKEYKAQLKGHAYGQENGVKMIDKGMHTAYGFNYANDMYKVIDSITKDDIKQAANYAFSGKPIYSIVASKDTLAANKEFLNSLAE